MSHWSCALNHFVYFELARGIGQKRQLIRLLNRIKWITIYLWLYFFLATSISNKYDTVSTNCFNGSLSFKLCLLFLQTDQLLGIRPFIINHGLFSIWPTLKLGKLIQDLCPLLLKVIQSLLMDCRPILLRLVLGSCTWCPSDNSWDLNAPTDFQFLRVHLSQFLL